MNFSALGGITVLVVAVLWTLVYIPAWTNRSQDRQQARQSRRQVNEIVRQTRRQTDTSQRVKNPRVVLAERLHQTERRVRLWATVAFTSVVLAVASLFVLEALNYIWVLSASGVALFAIATAKLRSANRLRYELLAKSMHTRSARQADLFAAAQTVAVPVTKVEPEIDPRAWTPNRLPVPLHLTQIGELQEAKLADVVELPSPKNVTLDSEQLDEILRRRRAIG